MNLTSKKHSGERFHVEYHVSADTEASARERAMGICLEQTVELPAKLVPEHYLDESIVGKIEELLQLSPGLWSATISYLNDTAGMELTQFLNVLFGNSCMKTGIKVVSIKLSDEILQGFKGARFGIKGLRALCRVPTGPMLMTALKPMGYSSEQLAEMAYHFALGGIDIIKDDHGLANQPFSRYEERVRLCAAAVRKANAETGLNCLYAPCLNAPAPVLLQRAWDAKRAGAGAVLMLPGITGFDSMRMLADDPAFDLPIIAHPALMGAFALGGMSHQVVFGTLCRLAGADATIFPNCGGRFGFSQAECVSISAECCREYGAPAGGPLHPPIFPTPGGGMTMDRIKEMVGIYGEDVMLLIGADLMGQSPDLQANARGFLQAAGRAHSPPPAGASKENGVDANNGDAETVHPRKRLKPSDPPVQGNHSKYFAFDKEKYAWKGISQEPYKPPTDDSWKGVKRTELIGKRGETPRFHMRYFEVAPGGYSSLEQHEHEHVVVPIRGEGEAQLNQRLFPAKVGDVFYTGPREPHQFSCPADKTEPFGFLCVVNADRDRPVPLDPEALMSGSACEGGR